MIKKKGIYLEKIPYGNAFIIIYYDGKHVLVVPNKNGDESKLYLKYSGTTFIDIDNKRTTLTEIISSFCPFGVNFICDDLSDFPLIDIKTILEGRIINWRK